MLQHKTSRETYCRFIRESEIVIESIQFRRVFVQSDRLAHDSSLDPENPDKKEKIMQETSHTGEVHAYFRTSHVGATQGSVE